MKLGFPPLQPPQPQISAGGSAFVSASAFFAFNLITMLLSSSTFVVRQVSGFTVLRQAPKVAIGRGLATRSTPLFAKAGQAEVVLVGCGAPNRGMGWYHGVQMLENK